MYCVYKHTSPSGKVYIGITGQNPLYRWNKGNGYSSNEHFTNAIRKYGWDNFKHEILFDGLTKEEACAKEVELIEKHQSNKFEFGYNKSSGGEIGLEGTQKGRMAWNKGIKMSDEFCKKVSKGHKGQSAWNKGKEYKQIYGKNNGNSKPIIAISKDGEAIKFEAAREAERVLLLPHGAYKNICACANGKIKSAYGYRWVFANV